MAYLPKGFANLSLLRLYKTLFFKGAPAVPVYTNAGAPTNGTSGTLAAVADPGALLIDTTNKTVYQNTNTLASPTWTIFTVASGSGAFTGTFDGLVGSVTPAAAVATTIVGTDATDSTSPTTGALKTAGGLGVAKTLSVGGMFIKSVAAGLTASATQTQVGGLALTKDWNIIATCATTGNAVTLATLVAGQSQTVVNNGANAAKVFPATSGNIDGAGANAAVTLTNGKAAIFMCTATNVIQSFQIGPASA
jgi:hypothetical protein